MHQQILHDVPGEFFPEGRPPFSVRNTVQRRRLQVISSLPHSQINQDEICPVFHKN